MLDFLKEMFGHKRGITEIPIEEIRLEERRKEVRENQLIAQVEKMDKEKEEIFREGAKCKSAERRKIYARRFNDLMTRIKFADRDLNMVSKELMLLGRIRAIRERSSTQTSSILSNLNEKNMTEIAKLLENEKITEEMFLTKCDELLGIANDPAYAMEDLGKEGSSVMKAWEAMDEGQMDFDSGLKEAEGKPKEKEKPEQA